MVLSNTRTISFTFRFASALSQEKLAIACLIWCQRLLFPNSIFCVFIEEDSEFSDKIL